MTAQVKKDIADAACISSKFIILIISPGSVIMHATMPANAASEVYSQIQSKKLKTLDGFNVHNGTISIIVKNNVIHHIHQSLPPLTEVVLVSFLGFLIIGAGVMVQRRRKKRDRRTFTECELHEQRHLLPVPPAKYDNLRIALHNIAQLSSAHSTEHHPYAPTRTTPTRTHTRHVCTHAPTPVHPHAHPHASMHFTCLCTCVWTEAHHTVRAPQPWNA